MPDRSNHADRETCEYRRRRGSEESSGREEGRGGTSCSSLPFKLQNPFDTMVPGDSPAEHEDGAGGRVIWQGKGLLEAQLLTATIEAIRTVDPLGIVVAASAVLHGPQLLRALQREGTC